MILGLTRKVIEACYDDIVELKRGDYKKCIKNCCSVFLRKQLPIVRYELIYQNPYEVLKTVCQHIGVDGHFLIQLMKALRGIMYETELDIGSENPCLTSLLNCINQRLKACQDIYMKIYQIGSLDIYTKKRRYLISVTTGLLDVVPLSISHSQTK